jgi:taurine--2-oxoglutarate transaminase
LNEERILDHVIEMGQYLGNRLKALEQTHKSVGEVRGIGLFWTVELVRNRETKEPFRRQTEKYSHNVITDIAEYLLMKKNIYIPADKFGIWVVPPLIVNREEIDFVVDSIDEALKIADDKAV